MYSSAHFHRGDKMQYEHLTTEEREEYHAWLDKKEQEDIDYRERMLIGLTDIKPLEGYEGWKKLKQDCN